MSGLFSPVANPGDVATQARKLPFGEGFLGSKDKIPQRPRCDGHLIFAVGGRDEEMIVARLNSRRLFGEKRLHVSTSPRIDTSERFGMGHLTHVRVNGLTNSVVGRYLPSASFARRSGHGARA